MKIRKLAVCAMFTALIMITTMISIPIGAGGYMNIGDSMIYACAFVLGGPLGGVAAAIGASMADITLGYPQYAPATLVIKFLMALVCGLLLKKFPKRLWARIVSLSAGAVIMVVGYVIYEYFLSSMGGAIAVIVPNLIQGVSGVILGIVIISAISKIKVLDDFINIKEAGDE